MEVHKHPQLHHAPKPWKEYILECFMIFIAVSMGFIAENIRVNFEEKHLEHEYIESMIKDLRVDTANIASSIKQNDTIVKNIDSMFTYINRPVWNDTTIAVIYVYQSWYLSNTNTVNFTEQTISQLKNGMGARLIKHRAALDSIMDYDANLAYLKIQEDLYIQYELKLFDYDGRVFNAKRYAYYPTSKPLNNPGDWVDELIKYKKTKELLIENDPKVLNGYIKLVKDNHDLISTYSYMLKDANKQATRLIKFLREEYKIKE